MDLVNFPRPVIVKAVRVIPLGTRVQADVPGGVRLGYDFYPFRSIVLVECFHIHLKKKWRNTRTKILGFFGSFGLSTREPYTIMLCPSLSLMEFFCAQLS